MSEIEELNLFIGQSKHEGVRKVLSEYLKRYYQ
jgi:hypothetical protein